MSDIFIYLGRKGFRTLEWRLKVVDATEIQLIYRSFPLLFLLALTSELPCKHV
jgi:hypothetical protein